MIINLLLNLIVLIIGSVFSWLPRVEKLPEIIGFDVDAFLVQGIGYIGTISDYLWPVTLVFGAALIVGFYLGLKLMIKLIMGHRAPN